MQNADKAAAEQFRSDRAAAAAPSAGKSPPAGARESHTQGSRAGEAQGEGAETAGQQNGRGGAWQMVENERLTARIRERRDMFGEDCVTCEGGGVVLRKRFVQKRIGVWVVRYSCGGMCLGREVGLVKRVALEVMWKERRKEGEVGGKDGRREIRMGEGEEEGEDNKLIEARRASCKCGRGHSVDDEEGEDKARTVTVCSLLPENARKKLTATGELDIDGRLPPLVKSVWGRSALH
ncbi:Protein of unknown function [Gryllus bimaculatus]|nr:Protein of unknown function [Gryllus bimaculatus]